jgi:ferredoxin/flavodoxin---NADP+ reductase
MHEQLQRLCATRKHVVAICGGAVSGSEAALYCAQRGAAAVVLEQNPRPYGKIEDGLPRWHDKLRAKEYEAIDRNLSHPDVYFVPCTKVGQDVSFAELTSWGLSAVLLANGAWRDRPLPVEGVAAYAGKGLVYQNPFVYWFNHYEEPGYAGPSYVVSDDAIVVGGGLASVDVVKIINIELFRSALRARGIEVDVVEMEHRGIAQTLEHHGMSAADLGVRGCTLYYRRRVRDMPLAFPKRGAPAEQLEKVAAVREKMVKILADKFLVRVQDCSAPIGLVVEDGRLAGLRFRRTEQQGDKLVEIAGSDHDVRSPLIVSSIGSVPEPVAGVPVKGELYDYADFETGALRGLGAVFGLGNVLTGKGNIRESRENAEEIAAHVVGEYLGIDVAARTEASAAVLSSVVHETAREAVQPAIERGLRGESLPVERLAAIAGAVERRWSTAGYEGDYRAWMERHAPYA